MFPHTWRNHWALDEDPFVQEDADKDPVLAKVPVQAVHSSFDRLYGSPDAPSPGIVFGEKGSGKSSLRLAMKRRLADEPVFVVEYTEFDSFLTEARKADRLPPDAPKTSRRVVERFSLSDHVDAILSLGVTKLANEVLAGKRSRATELSKKHKTTLAALSSLYYRSDDRAGDEVDKALRKALKLRSMRGFNQGLVRSILTMVGVVILAAPHLGVLGVDAPPDVFAWAADHPKVSYGVGALLLAATWGSHLVGSFLRKRRASRATKAVRVVPRDPDQLVHLLDRLPTAISRDLALPESSAVGTRLVLLQRFIALLQELGSSSFYVLMDRIDEATVLRGRAELMRSFIESLLEHRLLQFEGLALKLFLPIELSRLYLGASPEELKSMRLDKANSIPELRWSGQELAEVAAQRLRAVRPEGTSPGRPGGRLSDFLEPDIDENQIRESLGELGTPRLAFGFLSALFAEHARELDDDLGEESEDWRIPKRRFEILHASWLDRARGLRRALN